MRASSYPDAALTGMTRPTKIKITPEGADDYTGASVHVAHLVFAEVNGHAYSNI
jgi:hypothetical protein